MKRHAWIVIAAGALVLTACSSSPDASGSASPSASASNSAACLVGSWAVDSSQFATAADDVLTTTANGSLAGEVSLGFTESQMTATYNAKFTAKQPDSASKTVSDLSVEMRGGSTASYMANPSTLALSGGNSAIVLTVTTTTNGVTRTIKDVKPYQPLVSFSSGTVAYSCNGTSLYLTNQGGMVLAATRKT